MAGAEPIMGVKPKGSNTDHGDDSIDPTGDRQLPLTELGLTGTALTGAVNP